MPTPLPTPSFPSSSNAAGGLDLNFVRGVAREIGDALRASRKPHTLVFRSTMLPGSTAKLVGELLGDLEAAGTLRVFYYPEFLRESTAAADFETPSLAVVGSRDGSAPSADLMKNLFGEKAAVVNWPTAEMVKYACNAFHAAKITFAKEVGRVGKAVEVDARAVMSLLCQDTRLNISSYYMKPGNPSAAPACPRTSARSRTSPAKTASRSRCWKISCPATNAISAACSTSSPRPNTAKSSSSACPSSPTPTTSAKARWWTWRRRCSAAATSSASSIPR